MRVLLAGGWRYAIYEEAFSSALQRKGVEVVPFSWTPYLTGPVGRWQEKWALSGLAAARLNRALLSTATQLKPDVVFVWRGTVITPATVRRIRAETSALLVSYNNDDP